MTRTISIITATVGAALLLALPAYGDSWGADKAQPVTGATTPDWFERAAAVAIEKQKVAMLNARERGLGSQPVARPDLPQLLQEKNGVVDGSIFGDTTVVDARSEGMNRLYGLGEYANPIDVRERALVEKGQAEAQQQPSGPGYDARSEGMNRLYGLGEYAPAVVADDRFRIDRTQVPVSGQPTSSGNQFELPQVGIGLGVALVLILGLILTLKATHTRPFAH